MFAGRSLSLCNISFRSEKVRYLRALRCIIYILYTGIRLGHAVAHLVEAPRYKPEGWGFCSQWFHWNFSLTLSFWPHYGPGVDSASNRNEHQEYLPGLKAADA